jgi:lysophospholipase
MGGLLTALALIENPRRFAGSMLTAPMMGILTGRYSTRGLLVRARAARWLGQSARYLPGRTDPLAVSFEDNILTHDEGRWRRFRTQLTAEPNLRLGRVTWGWLELALKATAEAEVRARGARIGDDMTVMIAGEEALVDNDAARDFAERVGARLVEVEGSRHEILMETDPIRTVFWREFDRLAERVAPAR